MSARRKRVMSTEEINFNHKPAKMLLTEKRRKSAKIPSTVETLYSTIPYTTIFHITRWAHGPQNLQRSIGTLIMLLVGFSNKTTFRVICFFTARAVDSEWTHMWPAASVNNDGRTDYLRLSHLTALPAGVNYHLRCIHKGLMASSRVTPPIQMMIKQF